VGISIQLSGWWVVWAAIVLTLLVLLVRIPIVRFTIPKATRINEVSIMAVMIPKGLATAVLASIPLQQGIEGGELVQNIVYVMILTSIILTSVLIPIIEKTQSSRLYQSVFRGFKTDDS
jgi:NhaP-type Na+/H+ or K+/H+ antiporter